MATEKKEKYSLESVLNRLYEITRPAADAANQLNRELTDNEQGLLVLNDFALLNLIKNEMTKLRADYENLDDLKNKFITEIQKVGTELVRNAENRAKDVKADLANYKDNISQQLEEDIYSSYRKHFNTHVRELLLSQPEKILTHEFDDVVARAIRATSSDATMKLIKSMGDEIEQCHQTIKDLKRKLSKLEDEVTSNRDYINEILVSADQDMQVRIKENRKDQILKKGKGSSNGKKDRKSDHNADNREKLLDKNDSNRTEGTTASAKLGDDKSTEGTVAPNNISNRPEESKSDVSVQDKPSAEQGEADSGAEGGVTTANPETTTENSTITSKTTTTGEEKSETEGERKPLSLKRNKNSNRSGRDQNRRVRRSFKKKS